MYEQNKKISPKKYLRKKKGSLLDAIFYEFKMKTHGRNNNY
jgi:hypothetical protein